MTTKPYLTPERAAEVAEAIRDGLDYAGSNSDDAETLLAMALDAARLRGYPDGPSVERAWQLLADAAREHAALVAEGLPPLTTHEVLRPFREAGCLRERRDRSEK